MNILHISEMWPNKSKITSGVFVYHLVRNLKKFGKNNYKEFIVNKIYNGSRSIKYNIKGIFDKNFLLHNPFSYGRYLSVFGIEKIRGYNTIMSRIFMLKRLEKIIERQKIDLIHAHIAVVDGYLAYCIKKRMKIPYVMHLHGQDIECFDKFDKKYKETIVKVYSNANGIICNSSRTYKLIKRLIPNYKGNLEIIEFGVDLKNGADKTVHKSDKIKIVSVSNLIKQKKIDVLIQAIYNSKYKDKIELSIIGSGSEYEKLKNLVKKFKLTENVKFYGLLSNDKVNKFLPNCDIFVLPSVREAFGIVYIEALAAGLPAIGVKGQGCEDIAKRADCMLLVNPNDVEDLTEKIDYLIENPNIREKMGENGRKLVADYYSWEKIVERYETFYQNVK